MDVQALKASGRPADPFRQYIGPLLDAVGTDAFEQRLFDAAYASTRCSHLTAFVSAPRSTPRAVVAANARPGRLARSLAERYIQRYWHLDPANAYVGADGVPEGGAALRIQSGDIGSALYRSECYTGVDLSSRLSLIQAHGDKLYRINFYCSGADKLFGDDTVRHTLESADLLMALVTRHERASTFPAALAPDDLVERLGALQPAMTAREIQVCAGIVRGLTSEGIALENGIALNTVLTFRKRAYARLGISSQNELLHRVLHPRVQ